MQLGICRDFESTIFRGYRDNASIAAIIAVITPGLGQ
jgi:hypothetical protein